MRRITDYGAFVDIGGVDGLLHISEMSWTRIKHPSDVLKVGDEIQVMVLKTNLEQGRISLGLRQILPDPWTEARDRYQPGDIIIGDGHAPGAVRRVRAARRRHRRDHPEQRARLAPREQAGGGASRSATTSR